MGFHWACGKILWVDECSLKGLTPDYRQKDSGVMWTESPQIAGCSLLACECVLPFETDIGKVGEQTHHEEPHITFRACACSTHCLHR